MLLLALLSLVVVVLVLLMVDVGVAGNVGAGDVFVVPQPRKTK